MTFQLITSHHTEGASRAPWDIPAPARNIRLCSCPLHKGAGAKEKESDMDGNSDETHDHDNQQSSDGQEEEPSQPSTEHSGNSGPRR